MYRHGVTLLELVLFIAIMGIVIMFLVPFMVFNAEGQVRQQTVSLVRQTGENVLQTVSRNLRDAERIQYPGISQANTVMMLQSASGALDPTIFGLSGSTLVIIQKTTVIPLNPPQVQVTNFSVTNTSVTPTSQSLSLSFTVTRKYPLSQSGSYSRDFSGIFTLYPADAPVGNPCGCSTFTCSPADTMQWGVCVSGVCNAQSRRLTCTP